jgi:RHS repeat-associated protein
VIKKDDLGASSEIRIRNFYWLQQVRESENRLVQICNGKGNDYRFGFNSKEKDNEIKGLGNSLNFGARMYDTRLGRWMSTDPLEVKYPFVSPYNFALNNPIIFIDPSGEDVVIALGGFAKNKADIGKVTHRIVNTLISEAKAAGLKDFSAKAFAADKFDNVKKDVMDYVKANHTKGEKLVIYGYSWGGETATELAKDLKQAGYDVDLLITVDAAKGPFNFSAERTIPDNVKKNVNFYQTTSSRIGSRGGANRADNSKKTRISNIVVNEYYDKKIDHGNIDEATETSATNFIRSEVGLEQKAIDPVSEEKKIPPTATESSIENGAGH